MSDQPSPSEQYARFQASRRHPVYHEFAGRYPFTLDGVEKAVADAMAMKTVKSTIVPFPEMAE